jgi:hypothetical protein
MPAQSGEASRRSAPKAQIRQIAADDRQIRVTLTASAPVSAQIVEMRPYETFRPGMPPLWKGTIRKRVTLSIPRYAGARDRLYAKFQIAQGGKPVGSARFVTDLSRIGARRFPFPTPVSKKGITCPVDMDDIIHLGVKYINDNINLGQVFDFSARNPEETWEVDGQRFPVNSAYFRELDSRFKKLTDAGISITVVINNPVPTSPDPNNPFIHPRTDLAGAPNHLGGFNLTDERGLRAYRAAIEYFAHRYSRPDRRHGWITGYIVGNELQAHWAWYNLGRMPAEQVIREYLLALRVTDLAVRRFHSGIRAYVSMDHHWTKDPFGDPMQGLRGDLFLERVNALGKAEGDFPWHIAFHPYPEDLFNPRFWQDRLAVLRFDTPKITFKNLEVLPAYLRQPRFLYQGKPRHIILSEQGFHAADSPEGERLQAAAYALAYYKVSKLPQIDAFMLHRHVSARPEGGLRLGLWTWDPNSVSGFDPGRKMFIYEVFRQADTPDWREAFAFALPLIGIRDWKEADPSPRIDTTPYRPPADARQVVFDLVARRSEVVTTNCLDWRTEMVALNGRFVNTLFQHPKEQGAADATYRVSLPKASGQKLFFRFAIGFTGPTKNGARFAVLVDGQEVWSRVHRTSPFAAQRVDISQWSGKTIELTLRVDALGDASNDWANWASPQIVRSR